MRRPSDVERSVAGQTVPTVKPPTLGDQLNMALSLHGHSAEAAAQAMGVAKSDVLTWSSDVDAPGRQRYPSLLDYLQVDEPELRRLVLRGQMRRAQSRIRD